MTHLLFTTALRSGMLQRSLEASPCIKDSIKASGQENWRSEAYEDHKNQAGVTWFAVSVEEGPLTSCVRQSFPIAFLLFLFPMFG